LPQVLYPHFGVVLSPVVASAAMAMSSVSVVLNAGRLKRAKVYFLQAKKVLGRSNFLLEVDPIPEFSDKNRLSHFLVHKVFGFQLLVFTFTRSYL